MILIELLITIKIKKVIILEITLRLKKKPKIQY